MQITSETSALISGGASGLGAATARALAADGARLTLLDLDEARGMDLARETGGRFIRTDVTDPAAVAAAIQQAESEHGPLRIAVSCAGIAPPAKTVDKHGHPHDAAQFQKVVAVNLIGTFNIASQAAARMVAAPPLGHDDERGVIVNTASVAAFEGQIGQIAYAASKGGVVGLTLPMARDLARSGIRVMAIAPGLFLTPMLEGLPQDAQDSLGKQVPFPPRLGNPAEFAETVRHIVANPMLNGSVIRLDGAIRMGPR